uniref:RRM domain-containing protein n=1 Tax=Leptocylindrus danicus TaxID=163516 RepID=A0A7S2NYW4_9STRA|mmetsp:Transcript_18914/g.28104  ORF Transcript_18914/g.28104 Transcript_18914/m.28104 type:complete len:155 (+) Transcript_18914:143-607(+)|eukprot:CAMPEP_0116028022 /NCGR_PEP_ID=MMETSP0321-20121206/15103_1 /TAXON_ID=163516 /ORGANISM="Leptocylindrus danicus var. danicus, Strain B650" /LENGTH=154 /DNA_ID=CAMNT_0003501741 /DNA_START=139 /DNA_END=603 /DNA_ORIENTATION=+
MDSEMMETSSASKAKGPVLTSRRTVYLGGLSEEVHEAILRATCVPFGPVKSVDIPRDYKKGTHRGFGFVEFDDPDDAAEAIFNLHGSELYGRTLNVSVAQPHQVKLGSERAVWSTDEWFKEQTEGQGSYGSSNNAAAENEAADAVALKENAPVQ